MPDGEFLFFRVFPIRIDSVAVERGDIATGQLMEVSGSRLAIDSAISVDEADLIEEGDEVTIELSYKIMKQTAADLGDDAHDVAAQASAAWEATVCWDDDYSKQRLAEVRPLGVMRQEQRITLGPHRRRVVELVPARPGPPRPERAVGIRGSLDGIAREEQAQADEHGRAADLHHVIPFFRSLFFDVFGVDEADAAGGGVLHAVGEALTGVAAGAVGLEEDLALVEHRLFVADHLLERVHAPWPPRDQ